MRKQGRRGMEGLSALVMRQYPGKSREELEAVRVFGAWSKALSARITKNARPFTLSRGVLTVHTSNSAWASTLQLESESLLAKLRARAPGTTLRKLVFRQGALPEGAAAPLPDEEPEPGLPAEELPDDIARELARIADDGLRNAVAKAASAGLGTPVKRKKKKDLP